MRYLPPPIVLLVLNCALRPAGTHAQLTKELRADVIYNVCNTGGHLGSSLGVIELTVALHSVFDLPEDKVIWDVGHQAYPHKILTGRREAMKTLRQVPPS